MPMLRTTFRTGPKAIDGARLYVTARGIYEIFLNGKRVGDDYYNPGLTQYNITQMYQTYDVAALLERGDNAIGAMLGEGWWSGLLSFGSIWNHFGDRQSLLAKLVITYKDGTSETVTTNERTWKYYGRGPVVYSSLDFGEALRRVAGVRRVRVDDGPLQRPPVEGGCRRAARGHDVLRA
jgi:alpha-L-rhamnosidase